jgi:hypothetical protein
MFRQDTLNFKRTYAITGAFYHVIISADKPEIPLRVPPCGIARIVYFPSAEAAAGCILRKCRGGQLFIQIITLKKPHSLNIAHNNTPFFAVLASISVRIYEVNAI